MAVQYLHMYTVTRDILVSGPSGVYVILQNNVMIFRNGVKQNPAKDLVYLRANSGGTN